MLGAGQATLELLSPEQAELIGPRLSGRVLENSWSRRGPIATSDVVLDYYTGAFVGWTN